MVTSTTDSKELTGKGVLKFDYGPKVEIKTFSVANTHLQTISGGAAMLLTSLGLY